MLKICQKHVVDGLKIIDTPHVEVLPDTTRNICCFCDQKAKYILFLPYMKHKHNCKEDARAQKGKNSPHKDRDEENEPYLVDSTG